MGSHTSTVPSPRTLTPSSPSLFRVVPRRADDTLAFLLPVKPVFPYGTDRGPGGVGLCLSTPQWAVPDTCPGAHPGVRAGSGPPAFLSTGPTRGAAVPTGRAVPASRSSGLGSWQNEHVYAAAWAKLLPFRMQGGQGPQHGLHTGKPVPAPCPRDAAATLLPRPQQQGSCLPLPGWSLSSPKEQG